MKNGMRILACGIARDMQMMRVASHKFLGDTIERIFKESTHTFKQFAHQ